MVPGTVLCFCCWTHVVGDEDGAPGRRFAETSTASSIDPGEIVFFLLLLLIIIIICLLVGGSELGFHSARPPR